MFQCIYHTAFNVHQIPANILNPMRQFFEYILETFYRVLTAATFMLRTNIQNLQTKMIQTQLKHLNQTQLKHSNCTCFVKFLYTAVYHIAIYTRQIRGRPLRSYCWYPVLFNRCLQQGYCVFSFIWSTSVLTSPTTSSQVYATSCNINSDKNHQLCDHESDTKYKD